MIQKTRDYEMFRFRKDNREEISMNHVSRLKESINSRNLLELRPICVNAKMEVIDGQHRLIAAKALGVEIYYEIKEELAAEDIILMNVSKNWGGRDYLNYYVRNGYEEYMKLNEFINKNDINLKVALNLICGRRKSVYKDFKNGKFKFEGSYHAEEIALCWETINLIQKRHQKTFYTKTSKFWQALFILVKNGNFDAKKWFNNLEKMMEKVGIRVSTEDYLKLFMEIYNWRATTKINLLGE